MMNTISEEAMPPFLKKEIVVPEVRPVSKGLILFGFIGSWIGIIIAAICLAFFIIAQIKGDSPLTELRPPSEMLAEHIDEAEADSSRLMADDAMSKRSSVAGQSFLLLIPLFIGIGVFSLAMLLCTIVYMVVLYRGWKTVQSIRLISPGYALDMPTPGTAVGLLFVAYYNLYWVFPAYMGLEKYGTYLARLKGEQYTGPTASFAKGFGILMLISCILFFLFPITGIILSIMSFLLTMRINNMVETLGKSYIIDRSDETPSVSSL